MWWEVRCGGEVREMWGEMWVVGEVKGRCRKKYGGCREVWRKCGKRWGEMCRGERKCGER